MRNVFGKCAFGSVLALAACGSPGSTTSYVGLFNLTSTETSDLEVHSIDSTALSVNSDTGKLDRSANSLTISGLSGTIDAARTSVTLNGGGTISISNFGTAYVANYISQPAGGNPTVGIFGVATDPSDLPSGTASYAGSSILQIIDGVSVFDLSGDSTVEANFGSGTVDITYSTLNGTQGDGVSAPGVVKDVGTLAITGAKISGNTFSGGTAVLASTKVASILSGSQLVSTSGGFFGNNAVEVGGVNLINDTAGAGSLLILGTFIGK